MSNSPSIESPLKRYSSSNTHLFHLNTPTPIDSSSTTSNQFKSRTRTSSSSEPRPFNFQSIFDSIEPQPQPPTPFNPNHLSTKSVHFNSLSSPILPKRLFDPNHLHPSSSSTSSVLDHSPLYNRTGFEQLNHPSITDTNHVEMKSMNTILSNLKPTTSYANDPINSSILTHLPLHWNLQDSIDQNKQQQQQLIKNYQSTSFNHFSKSSSVNPIHTTHPSTPKTIHQTPQIPQNRSTPVRSSSQPYSPSNEPQQTPSKQLNSNPTHPSSKIPISLNPTLHSTGVKLGQKRLMERIRINLISLLIVWLVTSTKVYNEIISAITNRIPILTFPLQFIEWALLVVIIVNLIEGYYRLKTQVPITHVDLPLTPQQIRTGGSGPKPSNPHRNSTLSSSTRINDPTQETMSSWSPFHQRPQNQSSIPDDLNNKVDGDQSIFRRSMGPGSSYLSQDPLVNPLSRSTTHLFKRSVLKNSNRLSTDGNHSPAQSPSNHHPYHQLINPLSSSYPSTFISSHHPPLRSHNPLLDASPLLRGSLSSSISKSVRKVSNQSSLQKLLDETLSS